MAKRGRKGDGYAYKEKGRTTYRVVFTTIDGRRKTKRVRTKTEANAWLAEMRKKSILSAGVIDSTMRLGEWFDQWLASLDVATNTMVNYRMYCTNQLADLRTIRLDRLQPVQIERVLKGISATASRRSAYETLKISLNAAVRNRLLSENPCKRVPKPKHRRGDIYPFEPEEVRKLLKAVHGTRAEVIFSLMLGVGLRIGEALGIQWEDFSKNRLSIVRQAVEVRGKLEIRPPKTESGRRVIVLPQFCLDAVVRRKAWCLAKSRQCEWLLCTRYLKPMRYSKFYTDFWVPTLRDLELEHRGPHHARHTAATIFLNAGVPVHDVARILGHANPSITLNTYSHLMRERLDLAAEKMQRAVG